MSLDHYIEVFIPMETVNSFKTLSIEKIRQENWEGRNEKAKANNFLLAWCSEYAWKTLMEERDLLFEWANTYIGTVENAPLDFIVRINSLKKTIGIRSRNCNDLVEWKQVPYPDDRVRTEQERIEDFTIVACLIFKENGVFVRFYGAIQKERFVPILERTERILSHLQQEYFRPVDLYYFSFELMECLLTDIDQRKMIGKLDYWISQRGSK
ncbi:hypothetical protein ES703_43524 [subsurface metagenome]